MAARPRSRIPSGTCRTHGIRLALAPLLVLSVGVVTLAALVFSSGLVAFVVPNTSRTASNLQSSSFAGFAEDRSDSLRGSRTKSAKAVAGVADVAVAAGSSSMLGSLWLRLAPYPPFTLISYCATSVGEMSPFWRVYLLYSLGTTVAQKVVPGLYCQLFTGTWLALVSMLYPPFYTHMITQRLKELIKVQGKLKGTTISDATLKAAEEQLKDDHILAEALGSTPVLNIWHKMEKMPLDDPRLVKGLRPDSQLVWTIEALRSGYLYDLEAMGAEIALTKAADKAAVDLAKLKKAADEAAFRARHGALKIGAEAAETLADVVDASTKASESLKALDSARSKAERSLQLHEDKPGAAAWSSKLDDLLLTHSGSPAITVELRKLRALAEVEAPAVKVDAAPVHAVEVP